MKTLWFKGIYVQRILSGAKTHTDRKPNVWFEPGTPLDATVGPRPPFARLYRKARDFLSHLLIEGIHPFASVRLTGFVNT